jgi:methyl-accepting chemotaxis protein
MEAAKRNGAAEINKSSELDFSLKIHELTRNRSAFRQVQNTDDEMSANDLGTLVRQVSEASRREIGNLVDELQALDKKLQTDADWIQRSIEEYAGLSQQVTQLTTIISESVKQLPEARGANREWLVQGQKPQRR